jgi:membrane protease subunit HflK
MRERLYLEAMQEVYSNVTKVLIDTRQNSNLLYLPLDKIMQSAGAPTPAPGASGGSSVGSGSPAAPLLPSDPRARDDRSRTRDTR